MQDVRAKLPGPAHSLYYKDLIGNISSSNTVKTAKQVSAALFPKACSAGHISVDGFWCCSLDVWV